MLLLRYYYCHYYTVVTVRVYDTYYAVLIKVAL